MLGSGGQSSQNDFRPSLSVKGGYGSGGNRQAIGSAPQLRHPHGMLAGTFMEGSVLVIHPRMASEYDGASATKQLEPPGFMGLNYGHRTPLTTLAGQAVYGAVLGGLPQLQNAFA